VAEIGFDQRQAIESSLPYVITANGMFHRASLAAIGGFDEEFPIAGGEDTDLGWRERALPASLQPSRIEIRHLQRVGNDEIAPRLDDVTHQR
jgi:hypothetical protein